MRPKPAHKTVQTAALGDCSLQAAAAAEASSHTAEAASSGHGPIADLAKACCSAAAPAGDVAAAAGGGGPPALPPAGVTALLLGGALLAGWGVKRVLDTPSRAYSENVGQVRAEERGHGRGAARRRSRRGRHASTAAAAAAQEYDAWTEEGVLEYYWGEHIHLGYYTKEARPGGTAEPPRAFRATWSARMPRTSHRND